MRSTQSTPSGKPRLTTSSMIASIAAEGQKTKSAPFGHALVDLARTRSDVIGMTADLGKYTDLHIFAKEFPDRYYQMGMAEQLLFGAASGLAAEGFMPFATTYAVFASRRAYDFIHQTIAEENRNVKIAGALPGLTSGYGPSHQAAEDLALIRATPTKSNRWCLPSQPIGVRSMCAFCAAKCRWYSMNTITNSKSARRTSSETAGTS
jgi:transketolase